MEAASTTVTTYTAAVAISNLDAAVAQSKAAAALLLAAAAEISKLPAADVVTERHGDSAPVQALLGRCPDRRHRRVIGSVKTKSACRSRGRSRDSVAPVLDSSSPRVHGAFAGLHSTARDITTRHGT